MDLNPLKFCWTLAREQRLAVWHIVSAVESNPGFFYRVENNILQHSMGLKDSWLTVDFFDIISNSTFVEVYKHFQQSNWTWVHPKWILIFMYFLHFLFAWQFLCDSATIKWNHCISWNPLVVPTFSPFTCILFLSFTVTQYWRCLLCLLCPEGQPITCETS